MRDKFHENVEKCRVKSGLLRSETGEKNGAFNLTVNGKKMTAIISDGMGWDHVSVSMKRQTPTWSDMCVIKDIFFEEEEEAIQIHPKKSEYVNFHDHCLHLWRNQNQEFPTPHRIMV